MQVRLRDSGFVDSKVSSDDLLASESFDYLDKHCILVYKGEFQAMDGPVSITEEKMHKLINKFNTRIAALSKDGEIDIRKMPPVQLDHSVSARDTVGRVKALPLTMGTYALETGEIVPAVYGHVRFLGKDNVEKAKDGRYVNLSIGADLEEGDLSELTVTPFPAAKHATLLSRLASHNGFNYEVKTIGDEPNVYFDYEIMGVPANEKCGSPEAAGQAACAAIDKKILEEKTKKLSSTGKVFLKKIEYKGAIISVYQEGDDTITADCYGYISNEKTEAAAVAKVKKFIDANPPKKGERMGFWAKLKARLMGQDKLSAEDATKKIEDLNPADVVRLAKEMDDDDKKAADKKEKMKKKLMDEEKLSAEQADEKLSKMSDEDKEKLSAKCSDKPEDEEEKKKAKMAADRKETITRLTADFTKGKESTRLALNKGKITVRLSALKASAKITPAEVKKIEIDKLAANNEATIDAVLKSYEDREPVIHTGAIGSVTSEDASRLAKRLKMENLETETRMNMPSKRKKLMEESKKKAKLSEGVEDPANLSLPEQLSGDDSDYENLARMIDGEPDKEKVKAALKVALDKYRKMGGSIDKSASTEAEARMSELAEEVKKLHALNEDLIKLAAT